MFIYLVFIQEPALKQAVDTVEELHEKNKKLVTRESKMSKDISEKREEIIDLQTQLAIPQDINVDALKVEVAEKDRVINEQQARIEQLVEGKVDSSQLFAKDLGEKEALLAQKNKDLLLEAARVKASKSAHFETLRELDKYKRKLAFFESQQLYPMVNVEFQSISKPRIFTYNVSCQTTPIVLKSPDVTDDVTQSPSSDLESGFTIITDDDVYANQTPQELQNLIIEKDAKISSLKTQLKDAETKIDHLEQMKDHSKKQSQTMFSMRQELDATKVRTYCMYGLCIMCVCVSFVSFVNEL